ncbi:leucyl aminopeptidase [Cysteiniphilum sp. QT6929]|uniref:leucyl aminopeptidase n=1 Tax=Cysteiniphilum sp. QT6929 TaxID=2975055 RepID=UPI0024B35F8E|nr:leucyl aminopeptidase [Cysteiniphilum sp. QT6929]WHN65205.1 leucyl aminopeptidase [Cysteiniphilum sp. QT6929]
MRDIMQINALTQSPLQNEIVFVFDNDNSTITTIQTALTQGLFKAKVANTYFSVDHGKNYLAVGLGEKDKLNTNALRKAVGALYKHLKSLNIDRFAVDTKLIGDNHIRTFVEALINAAYVFDQLKSEKETFKLTQVDIVTQSASEVASEIHIAQAVAHGQNYAKDLKNFPANICTTDYLLNEAKKLMDSSEHGTLHYIGEDEMHKLGMGCITAVGRGSSMPSYIACMEYRAGNKDDKPIVLVGKGLVYDTGGLCLKPWQSMGSMKMDMGGAAAVFGTMKAIVELKLPINIIGAVALVENSIDGDSYRPGDVLTSMKGITVEIGNTDAEGRLALCDTLTYIERYDPKVVIDIATLTGAMVISLGGDITGLFGNNDALVNDIKLAAEESHDHAWHMPLHQAYHEQLKSEIADVYNIGGPAAGSITAALFLSKFTEKYTWAHLDVAGSAMKGFEKATATGRPVPMLTQYIINQTK